MASMTYSSSYLSSAVGLNTAPVIAVSGGGGAQEIIESVLAQAYLSTSAYAVTYNVTCRINFSSGSVEVTRSIDFNSGNASGDTFAFGFSGLSAAQCNDIKSITLQCSDSRIFVKHSQSVTVSYTVTTACSAPTEITVSSGTPAPGATVTIAGSGAAAGANNAITGYRLYRADSEAGAYSYLKTIYTAASGFSTTDTAPATPGNQFWYKALTVGSHSGFESVLSTAHAGLTATAGVCGAPASVALTALLAEVDPTLSWSGATSGDGNQITGYEIEYTESVDASTWGVWTALLSIASAAAEGSAAVTISPTRGNYRKYRIRTQGSLGADYASAWVETAAARRNSVPMAPAFVSALPAIYEAGGITVSWPASEDADGNVVAYELERAASEDGSLWGNYAAVASDAAALSFIDSPVIARSEYVRYRVRARDAFGLRSGYVESAPVRRNRLPDKPDIHLPAADKTTYNPRPRLLITLGADPDGQAMALLADGYTPSGNAPFAANRRLILRKATSAAAGSVTASIAAADTQGAQSDPVTWVGTCAALSWIDGDLIAGTTRIRAAHMNELRTKINTQRSYYGLDAYAWKETITAGATSLRGWAEHITELQEAVAEIISLVNGWDPLAVRNTIPVPSWVNVADEMPRAAAVMQLRSLLAQL